ncbi:hypothetical protein F5050DRAFT_1768275 [Lentinula boryana]|uniref:F-BAR domain-containing protein n=1 Tax=Lentinula boryana TaxID=40481 RepID=A0ABQ8Q9W4_9AGAR|nr:hypothetical protein F5050DRAFT_1768275 [Lentinula boryana]
MSSSTLSKYATAKSPGVDLYAGSTSRDFCNSFWGDGEAGVNVLFARMRGAQRTMEGMKVFWNERASIEEEYGRKLIELSERSLGKDEIGELKNSLRTLQMEMYKVGQNHLGLGRQIRGDNEERCGEMGMRLGEWRKGKGGMVEKRYKTKMGQESYLVKAQEKYYNDSMRIGKYVEQMKMSEDLSNTNTNNNNKVSEGQKVKMKRIEMTVGANEKDYEMFVKAVGEMIPGWEKEWKGYCDEAQDMEEERIEFMKDNLWAYANAVSTVCVADDESCENIRTVLDQLETEKEIIGFVQEYGTGCMIPNPPQFIPYSSATSTSTTTTSTTSTSTSSSSSPGPKPTTTTTTGTGTGTTTTNGARQAKFVRVSNKNAPPYPTSPPPPPPAIPPPSVPLTTTIPQQPLQSQQLQPQQLQQSQQQQQQTQHQTSSTSTSTSTSTSSPPNTQPTTTRTPSAIERRSTLPPQPIEHGHGHGHGNGNNGSGNGNGNRNEIGGNGNGNNGNGNGNNGMGGMGNGMGNEGPIPPIPANIGAMGTTGMSTTGNKILFYG